jgi:chloramphenicol 3-O phosphotransferase
MADAGQIIILNGVPRSGKSSIAAAIQDSFDGVWMNLGVDVLAKYVTPEKYRPGMGLRPGEEGHALVPLLPALFAALYDSIAAHSRHGLNVVTDIGHHRDTQPLLRDGARRLAGLPVLFVGVRCPVDIVMERRIATWGDAYTSEGAIPEPVQRWQAAIHVPGIYDLEVDTSMMSPTECAAAIRMRLDDGSPGSAFAKLAAM